MTRRAIELEHAELLEWLRSERGKTVAPWELDLIAGIRFQGRPTAATFDLILDALRTAQPSKTSGNT